MSIMWFRADYIKLLYFISKDKNLKYKDQSKTSLGLSWSSGTLTGQFGLNFSNFDPVKTKFQIVMIKSFSAPEIMWISCLAL